MMSTGQVFLVQRDDLSRTRIETFDAQEPPRPGEARVRIERFAFTANNITYAVFGESMHYWRFFPAPEALAAQWGIVPVWGFGVVEASACDGVASGERLYGYWPMASHAWLSPARVNAHGFIDGAAHRAELPAIYNRYQRVKSAPGYLPGHEGEYAVLRPLFATAWLIDDFLTEAQDFDTRTLLLSSASSKTAYATAFCLRQQPRRRARVVGLTSAARVAFCAGLGVYDEVINYDQVSTRPTDERTVYVDFAGDAALRRAVHGHWRDALAFSSSIGGTHHEALGSARDLPGPRPKLFFAPARMEDRSRPPPQGLGRETLLRQLDASWAEFMRAVTTAQPSWLLIATRQGSEAVHAAYLEVLRGQSDARAGLMLSLA
jgi:Protein of unknown function (DUF2855)